MFTAIVAPLALVTGAARSGLDAAPARRRRQPRPPPAPVGWADALTAIIPSNAIAAAAQSAMLPLVVFALFFGFALTRIEPRAHADGRRSSRRSPTR